MTEYLRTADYHRLKTGLIPHLPHPRQRTFLLLADVPEVLYGGAAGGGKLLYNGTMIPTPNGFRELSDLHPGDCVFGRDGRPHVILAESDVVTAPAYRLTFDDGAQLVAHDEHRWLTFDAKELAGLTRRDAAWRAKRRAGRSSRSLGRRSAKFTAAVVARNRTNPPATRPAPTGTVRTTAEIVSTLKTRRGRANHAIPVADTLDLPEKALPLDPYVLGVWLGDGTTANGDVTTADAEITAAVVAAGFPVRRKSRKPNNRAATYAHDGLREALKGLGLLGNKHIPHDYLWAAAGQRIALLQGLMDTDGGVAAGKAEFTSTRRVLAEGVAHLARSLGHKATVREGVARLNGRAVGPKWTVKFAARMPVFRLPAKAGRLILATRRTTRFRYLVAAERVDPIAMKCLRVSSPDRLFLAGEHFIPTHNSDAALMAAAQYLHVPGYAALLLRRSFSDLMQPGALIPRAKEWWLNKPGADWSAVGRRFTFACPGGGSSSVTFGYLEHDDDVYQYQGAEYQFVGIDELTQHREWAYLYLFSRLRKPAAGPLAAVPLRMRGFSNPGGRGHEFVKKRFVDPRTRVPGAVFVPAHLGDNPSLDQGEYARSLNHLDPLTRAQLLAGDWDAVAGGRFLRRWFRGYRRDRDSPDYVVTEAGERFRWADRPRFQTCDPAASTSQAADYFVLSTWLVTPRADLLWWDCERAKLEIGDQVKACQRSYRRHRPQFVGVEEVLNQRALAQLLRRGTDPVMVVKSLSPLGRDKLARAAGGINLAGDGRLYLPEDNPAFPLDDVVGELTRFTGIDGQDANDDVCLTPDAMVAVADGTRPISAVRCGDLVVTRSGLRPVRAAGKTAAAAPVLRLELADGTTLDGTGGHPIYVADRGFTRLDALRYGDMVLVWKPTSKRLSSTAPSTVDIRTPNGGITGCTSRLTPAATLPRYCSTGRFGSTTTDPFPSGTTFTTATGIRSTTNCPIWFALRGPSIDDWTPSGGRIRRRLCGRTSTASATLLPSGTGPKRAGPGTVATERPRGRSERLSAGFACDAAKGTSHWPGKTARSSVRAFVPPPPAGLLGLTTLTDGASSAAIRSALTDMRRLGFVPVCVSGVRELGTSPVYNLQVEGDHEYIANGILTHNCDTLSYAAECLPQLAPHPGGRAELPGFYSPKGRA